MINLEIKVKASNIEEIKSKALQIGAKDMGVLNQTDTYFLVGKKRLKLREEKEKSYLVLYMRPDTGDSKFSKYYIINIPLSLVSFVKHSLSFIFGKKVIVNKTRNLLIYKNTRIHLDDVKNLGIFAELETVVNNEENINDFKQEHYFVISSLGLDKLMKIPQSYSDLILN